MIIVAGSPHLSKVKKGTAFFFFQGYLILHTMLRAFFCFIDVFFSSTAKLVLNLKVMLKGMQPIQNLKEKKGQ